MTSLNKLMRIQMSTSKSVRERECRSKVDQIVKESSAEITKCSRCGSQQEGDDLIVFQFCPVIEEVHSLAS